MYYEPGKTKHVEMTLGPPELSMFDVHNQRGVEPGEFEVMVGSSSADVQKARLDVTAP